MPCQFEGVPDIATDYLLGRLTERERDAFEAHLFECDKCLRTVQALDQIRDSLERDRPVPARRQTHRGWMLAAAAVVALAVAGIFWSSSHQYAPVPRAGTAAGAGNAGEPDRALMALAAVDPPRFVPLAVRGEPSPFDRAMRAYASHDYAAAAAGLTAVAATRPDDPQVLFFLGVSRLMSGDAAGSLAPLRKTIDLGVTPYRQEASLLIAKALIRQGDVAGAKAELMRTLALPGDLHDEAAELARRLDQLRRR